MIYGLVSEFNPFHNGHKWLIDKVKTENDTVVTVMSSSFVQRGDISIISKMDRTFASLKNGVDLVLELPSVYSLSSAEDFGKSSIEILKGTNIIDKVVFGSECGDVDLLKKGVSALKDEKKNLSYGSAGQGNITHLGAFLFTQEVQTNPQHIPYRGSAPAMVDLVGGQTDFMMNTLNDSVPFIKDGKVIALALASKARNTDVIPDTPTLSEKLGKEFVVGAWQGIVAPKGTPSEIVNALNKAVNETLQSDSFKELAKTQGVEILGSSSEDYQAFINSETDRWDETVKKSGIQKN